MFDKIYELPISKDYVKHWGMQEAVREIIQNALDSDSPFEWEINNGVLTIKSKNSRLEVNTLLLGTTSKADNKDSIGSFGEGYKIALLVLCRLGYNVSIYNHNEIWTPEFRLSKKFNSEILCVISKNNSYNNEGITFEIKDLSEDDIELIKDSCLFMQKSIGEVKHTSKGLILMDRPGKLFIGGLLICDTGLDYGYDIKPQFLKLERDRQTVATFDLKWLVKDMWFEIDDYELVVSLMEKKIPDLEHSDYNAPEIIKDECYKHFIKQNGKGTLLATSQKEMEELVEQGLTKTVYVGNGGYSSSIIKSNGYKTSRSKVEKALSITEDLKGWLEVNKKHMRRRAIVNFNELIAKSLNWK